ncbi:MAG: mechanosensitive ion channel [Candidatus Brocadiia bacterium]
MVLTVMVLAALCFPLAAQETAPAAPGAPTVETIQEHLERLQADTDLSDQEREKLVGLYEEALRNVRAAEQWRQKAQEYERAIQTAPETLGELQQAAEQTPEEVKVQAPDKPVAQLETRLAEAQAELAAARERLASLETEQTQRAARRTEVPALVEAAKEKLAQTNQELKELPEAGRGAKEAAKATMLQTRKQSLEQELRAYEKELLSYDARGDLLSARRAAATREASRAEQKVEQWEQIVKDRRRREAGQAAREATRQVQEVPTPLREVAERNKELAEQRAQKLGPELERAGARLKELQARLTELQTDLTRVREKVEKVGMTKALGVLLRKKQAELPSVRRYEENIATRQTEIADVELKLMELSEERSELGDPAERAPRLVTRRAPGVNEERREQLIQQAEELLQTRQELLNALYSDYDTYFNVLVDLDSAERSLMRTVRGYSAFIAENILWYKSSRRLGVQDLSGALAAVRSLLSPSRWAGLGRSLLRDLARRPHAYALALLAFFALMVFRRRLMRALRRAGELAQDRRTDHMRHTLSALGCTVLLAAPWPLLLGAVGLLLSSAVTATEFTRAAGEGLWAAALALGTVALLRRLCQEGGVADAHLRWRSRALGVLRANLSWLGLFVAICAAVAVASEWMAVDADGDSLGRIAFIVGQVAAAAFLQRMLRSPGGVLDEVLRSRKGSWLERLRYVWYPLAVAVPLGLAVAAGAGYYYTARVLTWRLVITFWPLLGLVVGYELMLRWLFVARRQLALEQAEQRRAAAREAEEEEAPPPEEPELSVHAIGEQTRQLLLSLLGLGVILVLWLVWSDVVPALGALADIQVIDALEVSLADIGVALIIVAVTIMAAKNIPGLLEIAALQHLPLETAVRFAITRICRYAITVVGIIFAFAAVGITWEKVQWLAAAITVGLGFGLQEIFSNFVSGLIILFERPMRVGDTVTVGDVTGTVTKIRIRATTILDWDRKELVVPNREFITGRLINWTLSDRILRVIVPVGIAYGSDTDKAYQILLRVAADNPRVLEEPEPTVLFMEFGSSALLFELRVFVANVEDRLVVRHELHMAVDRAFREAGIEISFPQQDVHIRSIRAPLRLQQGEERDAD